MINGKLTTRNAIDAENENRAQYILSQEFRSRIDVFSEDEHCKIDFCARDLNGEITALFEFKKRGGNHDDPQYKRGWWIPVDKVDSLVRYGIYDRKDQGKPYLTNLFYCWGFNDSFFYVNIQEARVWCCDCMMGGLGYRVSGKRGGGREPVYVVPRNHPAIREIKPGTVDMPWRYQSNALAC